MKKKFFIGIAMSLFAVATIFNLSMLKNNDTSDILLEAIALMAKADGESSSNPCQDNCSSGEGVCRFMHNGMPFACDGWRN
jgi:hypothetical protein